MYYQSLQRLINILDELRISCPWDKKQTIQSLRPQTIEELYELTDAIEQDNWSNIKEELGDLLLHILFYSKIADEQNKFNIYDVIENISNKLIFRHPHIYNDTKVTDENEVKRNWEKLKIKEGKKSILEGVPNAMPAVLKAITIQKKVKQVGFDWEKIDDVRKKVDEEFLELQSAIEQNQNDEIENEMGDLLFSIINYARYLNIDPEKALDRTNKKFISRFKYIEQATILNNKNLDEMSLLEMDKLWNEAKAQEKNE